MDNGEFVMRDCYAFDSRWRVTKGTEGVGFEPTVGFPTLDFESSALNRTQPPFPFAKKTSNGQRPTSSVQRKYHADDPVCGKAGPRAWRVPSRAVRALADGFFGLTGPKNVTIFGLPCVPSLYHIYLDEQGGCLTLKQVNIPENNWLYCTECSDIKEVPLRCFQALILRSLKAT